MIAGAAYLETLAFAGPRSEPARLRGQPLRVLVKRNVAIEGEYAQVAGGVTTVQFPAASAAAKGDAFTLDGVSYVLDVPLEGLPHCWIVRPA